MRNLSNEEIAKFASRKGVKEVAVKNFLCSLYGSAVDARMNLHMDAKSYKWNAATVKAITDGITLANGG